MYIKRTLQEALLKTLNTRPVVYLKGPRQVGKSTLVQNLKIKNSNYITFDSPMLLMTAKNDPETFIKNLPKKTLNIIDEVQLASEIFRQIKIEVDTARKTSKNKSMFLLTGSANLITIPKLAEALVGRVSILNLLPFSSREFYKNKNNFIQNCFEKNLTSSIVSKNNLLEVIKNASFPEIALNKKIDRIKWFDDYLSTIVQRDVKNVAEIRTPEKILKILALLSQRAGSIINDSAVSSDLGMDRKTYEKYKAIILNTFLTFEIKPWSIKFSKRFIKSSKLYFTDTNMLVYTMHRNLEDLQKSDPYIFGHVLENFVATELMKQLSNLNEYNLFFYRTNQGNEIDFVIEKNNGDTIAIEVKASNKIETNDLKGILELKELCKNKFKKGIVLYNGKELVPYQEDIWLVPLEALWKDI